MPSTQIRCSFIVTNNWRHDAKITVQHYTANEDQPDAEYTDVLSQGASSLAQSFTKFSDEDDKWTVWVIPMPYGSGDDYNFTKETASFKSDADGQLAVITVSIADEKAHFAMPNCSHNVTLNKL